MTSEISPPPSTDTNGPVMTPEAVVAAMDDAWKEFLKTFAGFRTMDRASRTAKGQLAADEKPQGAPLLNHKGSANGVNVIELCCDLDAKGEDEKPLLPDNAKQYILTAMAGLYWRQSADMIDALQRGLDLLKPVFKGA